MITLRGLSQEARALLDLVLANAYEVVPASIAHAIYPDVKDKPLDELLDRWAEPYEQGEVPGAFGGYVAAPGRPRISDEENRVVSIRLPISVIEAADRKARRLGQTRSQRMR